MNRFVKGMMFFAAVGALFFSAAGQDTFSIVAVDTLTGEVGSAGASCIDDITAPGSGGAVIISDVKPGKGAIHTQAYYLPANQNNAGARMDAGDSPQEIIAWLVANDAQSFPERRQYGIVDFDSAGNPRAAAYTGSATDDWKGHVVGNHYAIQGNILLNAAVLDSMEARFLRTGGSLADKLMAALQGAKVPGADVRCLADGISSLSAFIRVARPGDLPTGFYLDLAVRANPALIEPIDSLQTLFDAWKTTIALPENDAHFPQVIFYPNPNNGNFTLQIAGKPANNRRLILFDSAGKEVGRYELRETKLTVEKLPVQNGLLFYRLEEAGSIFKHGKLLIIH